MINAIDLQSRFENTTRTKDKVQGKAFQTSDMEEYLNQAQDEWLSKAIKEFDKDERFKRLLAPLTNDYSMDDTITPTQSDGLFWRLFGIPEDIYSVVKESIVVNNKTVLVKPITYDEYLINIDNKYRRPYDKLAWRLVNKNGYSVISIYPSINKYKFSYVSFPNKIDIGENSEFSFESEVMNEIVDAAVALAIRSMEIESATTKENIQH